MAIAVRLPTQVNSSNTTTRCHVLVGLIRLVFAAFCTGHAEVESNL